MSRFGRWKFWGKEGKESGNESQDIKEMKKLISKYVKHLHKCTDYTSEKAFEALYVLQYVTSVCIGQPDKEKVIAAYTVDKRYPQLFNKMWESLAGFIAQQHDDDHNNLRTMIGTYLNFTDVSSEFSSDLGKTDCIPILIGVLDNYQEDLMSDDNILELIIALLVNIVQNCSDNIRAFRRVNAVPVLKKFLHLENQTVQTDALTILAFIADETEIGLLQTVDGAVVRLLSMINAAIHNEDHLVHDGGSCSASALELLQGLNKLAVNDANKVEVAKHGGIQVFARMLQDDFSEDEHIAAVKALWNLAFIEELRKSSELQESIKSLERLVISSNQELQHVCTYAMWEIKGRISAAQSDSISPPTYEEALSQPNPQLPAYKPQTHHKNHIMISYQWANQKETLKIRDKLTEAGYKVWMDVTHLRGSLLKAMSEAVEKSSIILVCMSEKYKNSTCCRAEAEYAFVLEKTVIPLRMDEEYTPDGWLGILVRGKLYHKFYSVDQIDSSMGGLLRDIEDAYGTGDVDDEVDGPVTQTKQEVTNSSASSCQKEPVSGQEKKSASQWSREDVQVWLKDNDLTELCETFKRCRGSHLEDMFSSCDEDKKAFNDELKSDYGIGNAQMRREFVVALKEAFQL